MKTTALSQMNMYNTSVLYGIQQMCTMIHTHIWSDHRIFLDDWRACFLQAECYSCHPSSFAAFMPTLPTPRNSYIIAGIMKVYNRDTADVNTENSLGLWHEIIVEKSLALWQTTHNDVLVFLRHLLFDVLLQPT